MFHSTRKSFAMIASATALAAALSASAVFAEEGHGGHGGGRGSDDGARTTVVQNAPVVVNRVADNDINDDRGVDRVDNDAVAAANQAAANDQDDAFDDND